MKRFFWKVMLLPLTFLQIWELVSGYFFFFFKISKLLVFSLTLLCSQGQHHITQTTKDIFHFVFLFGIVYLKERFKIKFNRNRKKNCIFCCGHNV